MLLPAATSATVSARLICRCRTFTAAPASGGSRKLLALAGRRAGARQPLDEARLVRWRGEAPPPFIETLAGMATGASFRRWTDEKDGAFRLVRALAVAGFAAMNIMLLSVSSGRARMPRHARHSTGFRPARLAGASYSGRVFFRLGMARAAHRPDQHGRADFDRRPARLRLEPLRHAPSGGPHAYFDAATSLLFFLLIGRTLDHMMREKARTAVRGLARLAPRGATVVHDDGSRNYLPVERDRARA